MIHYILLVLLVMLFFVSTFSVLMLLVGQQEGHLVCI